MAQHKQPFDDNKCGTKYGRDQHRRVGEPPCEPCRIAWNDACRKSGRAARDRGYVRPGRVPKVPCSWCGEPVIASRSDNPMHRPCRWEWRTSLRRAAAKHRRARAALDKAAAGTAANPRNPFTQGVCRYCRESFVRRNTPSPYCSSSCRRADTPKPVRASTRRLVFERDDYICQLCFEPTEPDGDPQGDWYPTVDHIIPQSKGGNHDARNLRCAHRWCNSVRGDETFYTPEILIA